MDNTNAIDRQKKPHERWTIYCLRKRRGRWERCRLLEDGAYFKCWLDAMGSHLKGSRLRSQPLLSIKKKRKGGVSLTQGKALLSKGWFSNRTGTTVDDGKAHREDWTRLPVPNLPLCHWSSQLTYLRAPSSTDVPFCCFFEGIIYSINTGLNLSCSERRWLGENCRLLEGRCLF